MNGSFLKIYADGGARGNPGPSACAFVVVEDGRVVYKKTKFLGKATNNEAEYNAVIIALDWLNRKKFPNRQIIFYLDSELVAKQLSGKYKIRSKKLSLLAGYAKTLERNLDYKVIFRQLEREKNRLADALVNQEIDENL